MLTRTRIRNLTHASFYARGLDLYLTDKVSELNISEASFVDRVQAKVEGSGSKRYRVRFVYDTAGEQMEKCDCDCPAYSNYDGLCKHLVAAMLKYVDRKAAEAAQNGTAGWNKAEITATEAGVAALETIYDREAAPEQSESDERDDAQEAETEYGLKLLLEKQQRQSMFSLLNRREFGKVKLEPVLYYDNGIMRLEFRIGITKTYVLKDVFEFAQRMREQALYRYGKELAFIHAPEMFAPQCRRLLQFLLVWAAENEDHFAVTQFYGYRTLAKVRAMTLTAGELEECLEASAELPITVIADGDSLGECVLLDLEPPRYLEVEGAEDGIWLKAQQPLFAVGRRYQYCFREGYIYREPAEGKELLNEFCHRMNCLNTDRAFIAREDVPLFCREFLPVLEQYYDCDRYGFAPDDYGMQAAEFEIYLDAPQENMISCRVIAVYGDRRYHVYGDDTDVVQRDLSREVSVGELVSSYCNAFDEEARSMVIADSEEAMYLFLTEGVAKLQTVGQVFISDALKRIKVSAAPRVSVGISLNGDLLELSLLSEDMSREQLLEILSKYDKKRKYYRLKSGEVIKVEDDTLDVLAELKQGIGLSDRQLAAEKIAVPRYRALFLDERLHEQESVMVARNRAFRALIRNMKTIEDNDFEVPEGMQQVLREYQVKGFLWLKTLRSNGFGGILADDMGLGKTLQVIAFLCSEFEESKAAPFRCLIVTPASLIYNWYNEVQRFAPGLPVQMVLGTAAERKQILEEAPDRVVLITSYDLLKRDLEYYENRSFACQVIDEAQFIKNHNTQIARAVKEIQADTRFALTGTPVENRLSELWSIFDYLMPGFLYGYSRFREELEIPVVQQQDQEAMARLRKMIRPFVLRRLKKDVLKELPDKLEEEMYVCLEGEQRRLYDAHVKRLSLMLDQQTEEEFRTGKIQILSELTRLRQLCCDPSLLYEDYREQSAKVDMCLGLIANAVESGHKLLLFSQFTSMLEILCNRMEESGITYYVLTGATSKERRRELVERFQQDDTSVFCISLKAGGTGLNLTAADIVIHYDPWWNLAVQNQATDRAHRIGQENMVTVYKLVTKGTIEENIMKLQERKRELAEQVLGGDGMGSGSFTREELREIIGGMGV